MKKLPLTRRCLQDLTRQIERLESDRVIGYPPRGTGVKAFAWEIGQKHKNTKKAQILRAQQKLIETGLIKITQTGNFALIQLTRNGAIQALKDRIICSNQYLSQNDNCLVVFDIPETLRKVRQKIRRLLSELGFSQLQLSVWITNKNIATDFYQIIHLSGLAKWVRIIQGKIF